MGLHCSTHQHSFTQHLAHIEWDVSFTKGSSYLSITAISSALQRSEKSYQSRMVLFTWVSMAHQHCISYQRCVADGIPVHRTLLVCVPPCSSNLRTQLDGQSVPDGQGQTDKYFQSAVRKILRQFLLDGLAWVDGQMCLMNGQKILDWPCLMDGHGRTIHSVQSGASTDWLLVNLRCCKHGSYHARYI